MEWLSLLLFISIFTILLVGDSASLSLAGTSLIIVEIGIFLDEFLYLVEGTDCACS